MTFTGFVRQGPSGKERAHQPKDFDKSECWQNRCSIGCQVDPVDLRRDSFVAPWHTLHFFGRASREIDQRAHFLEGHVFGVLLL